MPPDGVLLTTKLADILGVVRGDTLTVEVLEGERPKRVVSVVGVVDELIGLSAYMARESLNRLLREGSAVSGAFLAVDAAVEDVDEGEERLEGVLGKLRYFRLSLFRFRRCCTMILCMHDNI